MSVPREYEEEISGARIPFWVVAQIIYSKCGL